MKLNFCSLFIVLCLIHLHRVLFLLVVVLFSARWSLSYCVSVMFCLLFFLEERLLYFPVSKSMQVDLIEVWNLAVEGPV